MATVNPTRSSAGQGISVVTWTGMATGDTITTDQPSALAPAFGSVQFTGTFAGGTSVSLTGSNDGTNYVVLNDRDGTAMTATAAGAFEFSTAMRYVKPSIASGAADSVTATVIYRNQ